MDEGHLTPYDGSPYRVVCFRPDVYRVIESSTGKIVAKFRTERVAIEYFLTLVDASLHRYSKAKLSLKVISKNHNQRSNCQGCDTLITGNYYSQTNFVGRSPANKICLTCYSLLPLTDKAKLYSSFVPHSGNDADGSLASIPPDRVLKKKKTPKDSGSVYIVGSGHSRKR